MTEIDFEELDKAVNSIMSGGKRQAPARPTETQPPVAAAPAEAQTTDEVVSAVSPAPAPRAQEPSRSIVTAKSVNRTSSVAIPTRRSGRFMDVVHPSSNMKSTSTTSRNVSRNATTLEPLNQTAHTPDLEELNALLSDDNPSTQDSSMEPIATPFISNAKVEKRPLGGNHQTADTSTDEEKPVDDVQQPPAEPVKPVVIPDELTPDLLTIESSDSQQEEVSNVPVSMNDTTQSVAVTKLDTTPEPSRVIASEPSEPEKNDNEQATVEASAPAKKDASAGIQPIAIQQQYAQEPSTSPSESGAIYDTDSYHQPLVHVEKKKSGWMWVVWIVLLLILGASGGAVAYFLLLQ